MTEEKFDKLDDKDMLELPHGAKDYIDDKIIYVCRYCGWDKFHSIGKKIYCNKCLQVHKILKEE